MLALAAAGLDYDATGHVRGRQHLGELDRCKGRALGGDQDDGVSADDHRCEPRHEPREGGSSGASTPTTPVGSGTVKLK